jgi:hypothetical protein
MMKQADKAQVARLVRPNDFNDYAIKVVGKRVTIRLNGETTINEDFPNLPADGYIGWQLHAGAPMEVIFRDVHFRDLSSGDDGKGFVSLFDGKNLDNWTGKDGGAPTWTLRDGYVEPTGKQFNDLVSRDKYMDFDLHVEFWIPRMEGAKGQGRGNSGVYLQGRYEIQILDNFQVGGTKPEQMCGALYGIQGPSQNVCKPPEEWQTFDISFQAPRADAKGNVTQPGRVTLLHNGVKVLDDVAVDKVTGSALDKQQGSPGPIMLQNHGSAVRFRNIKIRPRGVADALGFTPLFNGKDLSGWQIPAQANPFSVHQDEKAIVARPSARCATEGMEVGRLRFGARRCEVT